MTRVLCQHCWFWEAAHAGSRTKSKEGRRRRNAPASLDRPEQTATHWPATFDNDWCGDGLLQVEKPLAVTGWRE